MKLIISVNEILQLILGITLDSKIYILAMGRTAIIKDRTTQLTNERSNVAKIHQNQYNIGKLFEVYRLIHIPAKGKDKISYV